MPVVTDPRAGLHDDQVEADREWRQRRAIRQAAGLAKRECRTVQARPLATVDGFLGQPEVTPRPPPHLDHDERRRWTRVYRQQVDLRAADAKLSRQDAPTGGDQVGANT
jgi:hypothetical protein